jgi:MFS family permease
MVETLILIRAVQVIVGFVAGYFALRIFERGQSHGWRYVYYSSVILYIWPVLSLVLHWGRSEYTYVVDALGVPFYSIFLGISAIAFISEDYPVETPSLVNLTNFTIYAGAVLGLYTFSGLVLSGFTAGVFTFFYYSTMMLILPAFYGISKIPNYNQTATWISFLASTILVFLSTILNLYASSFCGKGGLLHGAVICDPYSIGFHSTHSFPLSIGLLRLSFLGPSLSLAALLAFGMGCVLLYYHLTRKSYIQESEDPSEKLVQSVVKTFEPIIGASLARRISGKAFEDVDGVKLGFMDEEPVLKNTAKKEFREITERLASEYESTLGPVGRRRVESVAKQVSKGEEV